MLFGGGLFGGQLFVGNLYGGAGASAPEAPLLPYYVPAGGYRFLERRSSWSDAPTRAERYQAMIQQDEEDVLMAIVTSFVEEHDRWDR